MRGKNVFLFPHLSYRQLSATQVMAEQSARVAQRCEEAKATCELRLDSCDLRKFPDAVFFLMKGVDLQTVTLAHNSLTKIPAKLGAKFSTITSEEYT